MNISTETREKIDKIRSNGKKDLIIFISGNFNILHSGHIRLISFAKQLGGHVVVGINPDTTRGVIIPEKDRIDGVKSLTAVDSVIAIRDNLVDILRVLKPNIVVKGKEHETRHNIEDEIVKEYGGKLLFSSGESKLSSIELIRHDFDGHETLLKRPSDFLSRHEITPQRLFRTLEKMKNLKVVVIGDLIVDEYITCEALGLSQEDPTIVVSPLLSRKFIGGAGIVASHAYGLGAQVDYFSVVGQDETATFARQQLDKNCVSSHLLVDESRPTTLKQRFRTQEKTLLRVNHLSQRSISEDLINNLYESITPYLKSADLVIFSDFNYGTLPQKLVDRISNLTLNNNTLMVADSQSSSQVGDITRFKNMSLITPTEREARLGVRDFEAGLAVLGEKLIESSRARHAFITLGGEGLLVFGHDAETNTHVTDRIPALNMNPKDTSGAGDSMLVSSSMALAAGEDIWTAAAVGSIAAGCQVGRVGNIPLSTQELADEIGQ